MLRFGGITADENVGWTDASTPRPAWASSAIGPDAAARARRARPPQRLAGDAHGRDWRTTNRRPRRVRSRRHTSALGPYLAAVEIGNEPNAYGSHGFRELPWIAQGYEEEVSSYREAIEALTPGVPIAGPDVSGSGAFAEWGEEEALAQTPALLTGHHYPLGCAQTPAPSIETLLSAATRGREAHSLGDLHVGGQARTASRCVSTRPTRFPAAEWRASATRSPRRCGRPVTSLRRWRPERRASTCRATQRTAAATRPSAHPIRRHSRTGGCAPSRSGMRSC